MNGYIIAPLHNEPGRKDATGAFQLGAGIFQRVHSLPAPVYFNNEGAAADVCTRFLGHLNAAAGGWDVFAYFGHGDRTCLPSANIYNRRGAAVLAKAILPKANPGITVLLYACTCGAPGGFASWLAEELSGVNATVYAHNVAGHSFTNAEVVAYPGGEWVIPKGHRLWHDWYHDMHSEKNDLWARFPFMTRQALEVELEAPEFLLGRWAVSGKGRLWDAVFFGDRTVARTAEGSRYGTDDRGTWAANKHKVTVTWNSGAAETWAAPLSLKGQNVRRVSEGETLMLKARRTETLEFNPQGLFRSARFHLKQSGLIKLNG